MQIGVRSDLSDMSDKSDDSPLVAGSTRRRSNGVCVATLLLTPVAWGLSHLQATLSKQGESTDSYGLLQTFTDRAAGAANKVAWSYL